MSRDVILDTKSILILVTALGDDFQSPIQQVFVWFVYYLLG